MHPGGKRNILKGAFKDASSEFHKSHHGLDIKNTPLVLLEIGQIDKDTIVNNQIKVNQQTANPDVDRSIQQKDQAFVSNGKNLSIKFGLL